MNPVSILTGLAGWYAAAGVAISLDGLLAVQTVRLADCRAAHATDTPAFAKANAAAEKGARIASEAYRALEAQRNTDKQEAQRAIDESNRLGALSLAAERARSVRLSRDIAAFAAGGGRGPAQDSVPACRDEAAALGDVLAGSLRAEEELAGAAEDHAASVRALLHAWPRNGEGQ